MNRPSASSPLLLTVVLAFATIVLALLLFVLAGDRSGMHPLPAPGTRVEILPDPGRAFAWPEPLAQPDSAWQPWSGDGYIHAGRGDAVWVRVTFTNASAAPIQGVLADAELNLDRLDCWIADPAQPGAWLKQSSGEAVPGREKAIWGRQAAFFVTVPAGGETVAYLRAEDHFAVWLRAVWWPEARTYLAVQLRDTIAETIYFGVVIALFIYNGVLWARLRHRDLGYYLGYLGSMALVMALARSQVQLLGPAHSTPAFDALAAAALACSGFFAVQFARTFLGLADATPRLDRVARGFGWLNVALGLGSAWLLRSETNAWFHLTVVGTVATHGVLVTAAAVAWFRGVRHARYFLLSFGLLLAGAIPFVHRWVMTIPLGITALGLLLGSALEMLLLSLALADRFARLESERFTALLAEEQARLALLRYQLNPHFLFNALNSLYSLIYPLSKPAGELVRRIADFCRETFTGDAAQWRALGEELALLRTYLDIEQARWRQRLAVAFATDPAADAFRLPAFLLLPLVENAIKHGGATSPDPLAIRISTRVPAPDAVEIEVANTGRWIAPGEPRSAPSHGIGLNNLRTRLARAFPDAHHLDVTGRDGWVHLTLRLKIETPKSKIKNG